MSQESKVTVYLDNIPDELKAEPRWLGWRWVEISEGDWQKKPVSIPALLAHVKAGTVPTDIGGSSTNPATWTDFETASAALQHGIAGIGFVLGGGWAGVDLDDCVKDGVILPPFDLDVTCLRTYAEISPSGTGVKLIMRADLERGRKLGNREAYAAGRFFTVTGNVTGHYKRPEARQAELDRFVGLYFPEKKVVTTPGVAADRPAPDDAILRVAFAAKNGDAVRRLYEGDVAEILDRGHIKSEGGPDWSEAVRALLRHLVFYTQDPVQLDALMAAAPLVATATPKWPGKWERLSKEWVSDVIATQTTTYKWPVMWQDASEYCSEAPETPEPAPRPTPAADEDIFVKAAEAAAEQAVKKAAPPKLLRWSDLKKIAASQQEDWIVKDLLESGTLGILCGLPYCGKTTLVSQLIANIATGTPFLGRQSERVPIVLVNADKTREKLVVKRIERSLVDEAAHAELEDLFFTPDLPTMPLTITADYIRECVEGVRATVEGVGGKKGLIIVDTLRSAVLSDSDSGAENDSTTIVKLLLPFKNLARQSGWAVVFLHHNSRGRDTYAGSAAIAGTTDSVWTMRREEKAVVAHLDIITRDGLIPTMAVRETATGLELVVKPAGPTDDEKELVAFIGSFPETAPMAITKDDVGELQFVRDRGWSKTTLRRRLTDAQRPGVHPRLEQIGRGTRHDPYRFFRV